MSNPVLESAPLFVRESWRPDEELEGHALEYLEKKGYHIVWEGEGWSVSEPGYIATFSMTAADLVSSAQHDWWDENESASIEAAKAGATQRGTEGGEG